MRRPVLVESASALIDEMIKELGDWRLRDPLIFYFSNSAASDRSAWTFAKALDARSPGAEHSRESMGCATCCGMHEIATHRSLVASEGPLS